MKARKKVSSAADGVLENLNRFRDLLVSFRVKFYIYVKRIEFGYINKHDETTANMIYIIYRNWKKDVIN